MPWPTRRAWLSSSTAATGLAQSSSSGSDSSASDTSQSQGTSGAVRGVQGVDHVCLCATDIRRSIGWYRSVLGFELQHADQPNFWPTCPESPAFLRSGSAQLALLPLPRAVAPVADHNGAHVAFGLGRAAWKDARGTLPGLLRQHRTHAGHSVAVEEADYGLQLSLFFDDPDRNVLELTTWVGGPAVAVSAQDREPGQLR
jgi:catechol 2,3-dioxygenase-like lactoylglutathione lyase family enzyme